MQRLLSDVPERRVAKIVGQRCRFNNLWMDAKGFRALWCFPPNLLRESTPELCHLQRVRQAIVECVAFNRAYDFGDACQAFEGRAVEHSIAVAFEWMTLVGLPALSVAAQASISLSRHRER